MTEVARTRDMIEGVLAAFDRSRGAGHTLAVEALGEAIGAVVVYAHAGMVTPRNRLGSDALSLAMLAHHRGSRRPYLLDNSAVVHLCACAERALDVLGREARDAECRTERVIAAHARLRDAGRALYRAVRATMDACWPRTLQMGEDEVFEGLRRAWDAYDAAAASCDVNAVNMRQMGERAAHMWMQRQTQGMDGEGI